MMRSHYRVLMSYFVDWTGLEYLVSSTSGMGIIRYQCMVLIVLKLLSHVAMERINLLLCPLAL